jgi:hypothetical protein
MTSPSSPKQPQEIRLPRSKAEAWPARKTPRATFAAHSAPGPRTSNISAIANPNSITGSDQPKAAANRPGTMS